jgi:hypothetical protein
MKKCLMLLIFGSLFANTFSQLQDRYWIFGKPVSSSYNTNATLYFGNPSNPVINLPNGQPNNITTLCGTEGWGVITHPYTGNLIFYTDGKYVFDNNHNMIDLDPGTPGYEPLGGDPSSVQPVAISLVPGSAAGSFFIFSNPTGGYATYFNKGHITYRIYNTITDAFGPLTTLPGPYGLNDVSEGLKIIASDTDCDILWLIVSLFPDPGFERKYVVYKIDQNVVSYQAAWDIGPNKQVLNGGASPIICMTTTKANTAVGITNMAFAVQYTSSVFTIQFDNVNGAFLPNTERIYYTGYPSSIPSVYCVEFSPGARFLYYSVYYTSSSTNALYQLDLLDSLSTAVLVHTFNARYAGGMKLGPDSLIYHIWDCGTFTNQTSVGRILQPDTQYIPGSTVFAQFYELNFHTYTNVIAGMFDEFLVLPCTITGLPDNVQSPDAEISLNPNPVNDMLIINAPANSVIEILNLQGTLIKKMGSSELRAGVDVSQLPSGVYLIRCRTETGRVVRKFVKL